MGFWDGLLIYYYYYISLLLLLLFIIIYLLLLLLVGYGRFFGVTEDNSKNLLEILIFLDGFLGWFVNLRSIPGWNSFFIFDVWIASRKDIGDARPVQSSFNAGHSLKIL